jgi:hypothetical protein
MLELEKENIKTMSDEELLEEYETVGYCLSIGKSFSDNDTLLNEYLFEEIYKRQLEKQAGKIDAKIKKMQKDYEKDLNKYIVEDNCI